MYKAIIVILFLFSQPLYAQETNPSVQQLQKLNQVYRYLNGLYVDDVEMAPLVEKAVVAMLEELDPHSAYVDAEEMKGVQASFDGEFSGIGVEFNIYRDSVIVVNTIAGGPAERVGVLPNDRIVRIDTTNAVGFKQVDVPKYLRGKSGTKVSIEVIRAGELTPLHFVIVRDKIPLHTVDAAYMAADGVGYIKVNRFGNTTMREFREAYSQLHNPKGLILDLRGNGGGLLDQAIEMAEFFLPAGSLIVSTEGRAVPPSSFEARKGGDLHKGKLIVLIDESSASASEIVAGAIQDWDRGLIAGRQSFGKGLVQRQFPLGDGSAVRITVARYHTPSGRVIQRPYKKGKREEYYLSHLRRYTSNNKDSLASAEVSDDSDVDSLTAKSHVFTTLKTKRKVFGGGGITPDILIESDTTGFTAYYGQLIRRGIVNEFVMAYMDRERAQLADLYPTFESFERGFSVSNVLIDSLTNLGVERHVAINEEQLALSLNLMRLQIKALVAQRLFNVAAFYRVMNAGAGEEYQRAVEIFLNWQHDAEPLLN